jgi:type IX secretion system PorP/SprF family membrane protein
MVKNKEVMKRIGIMVLCLLACGTGVYAQQSPYYTQYVLNPFVYNPALAGIENYWDVKLSYRHQWQGVEGAPRTTYLTVNGPLRRIQYHKGTTNTVPLSLGNRTPAVREYWKNYKSIEPHAGVGMVVYYDQAGPLSLYSASACYAYHIGLSPRHSISAGLAAGVHGYRVGGNQLNFGNANPDDPVVGTLENRTAPHINLGIWFYAPFYFIGISAENLVTITSFSGAAPSPQTFDGRFVPHYTFSAGYKMLLKDYHLSFLPSVVMRYVPGVTPTWDVNLKFQYRNSIWTGFTTRSTKTVSFLFGANLSTRLNFGYSYDFLSALEVPPLRTHEIVIGYLIGNKSKVLCPRDFW